MSREALDLDARLADARREREAARAESKQEPLSVRLGGVKYALPFELPVDAVGELAQLAEGDISVVPSIVRQFLPDAPPLGELGLSIFDGLELVTAVAEGYGLSLGESAASSDSSPSTSARSRPTSSASTGSTSGGSVGAKKRSARAG